MPWQNTKTFSEQNRSYNAAELNRENNNLQYLRDKVVSYGYPIGLPKPVKIDFTRFSFPTVSVINNLRENINVLVAGFYPIATPTLVVNGDRIQPFGYAEANAIERSLQDIYNHVDNMEKAFKYSGTFRSGQDTIL